MTKHPLLFVALLTLLSVVAALIILHFSPGEQGASWKVSPSLKFLSWRRTAGRSPSQMA